MALEKRLNFMKIKSLSLKEVENLDKKAIYSVGIPRIVLMENAGRNVAEFIMLKTLKSVPVVVLAGCGYNGGDGLVLARHLFVRGFSASIFIVGDKKKAKEETVVQMRILKELGLKVKNIETLKDIKILKQEIKKRSILVDALLGVGVKGQVREPVFGVIEYINSLKLPVFAVDIPSGIDANSGAPLGVAVKATYTVSFQGLKKGFFTSEGRKFCGRVIPCGIGV